MPAVEEQDRPKKSKVPLYISIAIVLAVLSTYFLVPDVRIGLENAWEVLTSQDQERTKEWVSQFGIWGPLMVIGAMIAQMFLIIIPSPFLMAASVLAYGPYWGSVIAFVAIFCASSVGYAIGAYLGAPVVMRLIGEKSEKKIERFILNYGFWAVFIFRLSPFLSNDAISFVGGILKMGYWRFIGASMLGISPLIILIAYLGESNERLKNGLIWASIAGILLFFVYLWLDRKKRQ